EYVFNKLSELFTNEKMVKTVVANVNKERVQRINPAKKELEKLEKELEKIEKKKNKIFEAYEDDILTKEEFQDRKKELNERAKKIQEQKQPLLEMLSDEVDEKIPYEYIKSILENFSKVLNGNISREQQKKLLHMIISEITINELREIDSIKIKIDDNLVDYLSKEEGVSVKGTPSSFGLINIGLTSLSLNIII
ncbi:MAG: recombinase family protein, partial [Clostridiales bacterium]|nr:recombinase family protein [Clostridiales bacterium]